MKKSAPLSLDRGGKQVEAMIKEGMPFSCVEDLIEETPLPRDHKAALWLLAWSLRDPAHQRHDARLTLGLVNAGELRIR